MASLSLHMEKAEWQCWIEIYEEVNAMASLTPHGEGRMAVLDRDL